MEASLIDNIAIASSIYKIDRLVKRIICMNSHSNPNTVVPLDEQEKTNLNNNREELKREIEMQKQVSMQVTKHSLSFVKYFRRKILYLSNKFNAIIFEITGRSELLHLTINYIFTTFNKFTQAVDKVRSTFKSTLTEFYESFNKTVSQLNEFSEEFEKIDQTFETTYQLGKQLELEGKNASEMVKEISNIAERTNILALNAAIQAAHAGTYGKAFSVVASEIRKLADNSKKSTQNIQQRLTLILDNIAVIVQRLDTIKESVDKGSEFISASVDTANTERRLLDGLNQDFTSLMEAFDEYEKLKENLERMYSQSDDSNKEIFKMVMSFKRDIDSMERLKED